MDANISMYGDSGSLAYQTNTDQFLSTHNETVQFYAPGNELRLLAHRFVMGDHYESNEKSIAREKGKGLLVFNQLDSSRRTIMGQFLSAKYNEKFSPFGPEDSKIADKLQILSDWESEQQKDSSQDIDVLMQAWAGGNAFRMVYMDVRPGRKPVMRSEVVNPFNFFFDPASRDLITRDDAEFLDIRRWVTVGDLLTTFPKYREQILKLIPQATGYVSINNATDSDNKMEVIRNGRFLVITRYYRHYGYQDFIYDKDGGKIKLNDSALYSKMNPDAKVYTDEEPEQMYVAVCCPAINEKIFLYNGPYHCQARNQQNGRCYWPGAEIAADSFNGQPMGFVSGAIGPSKVIDYLVSNIVESAKHAAGAGYEVDESAFISKAEARKAVKYGADSNQRFLMKAGKAGQGMVPIKKSTVNQDHSVGLDLAKTQLNEQMSTPPAMQGLATSDNPSGVLNQQRIEMANIQLSGLISNFRAYRKRILQIRLSYWAQYYTDEFVVRLTSQDAQESFNTPAIAQDKYGNPIPGKWTIANDLSKAALYDVVIEESTSSPTYRQRVLGVIGGILQNPALAQDPELLVHTLGEWIRYTDVSQEFKDYLTQKSARTAQMQANQQAMDQFQQLQGMAQTEAKQSLPGPPPGSEIPTEQPLNPGVMPGQE